MFCHLRKAQECSATPEIPLIPWLPGFSEEPVGSVVCCRMALWRIDMTSRLSQLAAVLSICGQRWRVVPFISYNLDNTMRFHITLKNVLVRAGIISDQCVLLRGSVKYWRYYILRPRWRKPLDILLMGMSCNIFLPISRYILFPAIAIIFRKQYILRRPPLTYLQVNTSPV